MNKKLGQEPEFATQHTIADANDIAFKLGQQGMSKRFYAACSAMQGIFANTNHRYTIGQIAEMAFVAADELLKQEQNDER